jgi:hypothetical protein
MQVSSPSHCRSRHHRVAFQGIPCEAAIHQHHHPLGFPFKTTAMVNIFLSATVR